jgi:hypothetical protein
MMDSNRKSFTGSSKKKERLVLMSWLPKLRWSRGMGRRGLDWARRIGHPVVELGLQQQQKHQRHKHPHHSRATIQR